MIEIKTYCENKLKTGLDDLLITKGGSSFIFKGKKNKNFKVFVTYIENKGYELIIENEYNEKIIFVFKSKKSLRKSLVSFMEKQGFKEGKKELKGIDIEKIEIILEKNEFDELEFKDYSSKKLTDEELLNLNSNELILKEIQKYEYWRTTRVNYQYEVFTKYGEKLFEGTFYSIEDYSLNSPNDCFLLKSKWHYDDGAGETSALNPGMSDVWKIWSKKERKFLSKMNNGKSPTFIEDFKIDGVVLGKVIYTGNSRGYKGNVQIYNNNLDDDLFRTSMYYEQEFKVTDLNNFKKVDGFEGIYKFPQGIAFLKEKYPKPGIVFENELGFCLVKDENIIFNTMTNFDNGKNINGKLLKGIYYEDSNLSIPLFGGKSLEKLYKTNNDSLYFLDGGNGQIFIYETNNDYEKKDRENIYGPIKKKYNDLIMFDVADMNSLIVKKYDNGFLFELKNQTLYLFNYNGTYHYLYNHEIKSIQDKGNNKILFINHPLYKRFEFDEIILKNEETIVMSSKDLIQII